MHSHTSTVITPHTTPVTVPVTPIVSAMSDNPVHIVATLHNTPLQEERHVTSAVTLHAAAPSTSSDTLFMSSPLVTPHSHASSTHSTLLANTVPSPIVNATSPSPTVIAHGDSEVAPSTTVVAPSVFSKSHLPLSPVQSSQPQWQPLPCRDGRDKREKHDNTSRSDPFATTQGTLLINTHSSTHTSCHHPPHSTASYPYPMAAARHLADSATVALTHSSAHSASSPAPISAVAAPFSTARTSTSSSHIGHQHAGMSTHVDMHTAAASSSPPSVTPPSTVPLTATDRLIASLRLLSHTHKPAAHSSHTSASASAAPLSLDNTCHCLVVDQSRIASDSADSAPHASALTHTDTALLRTHVAQWLFNIPIDTIAVAYVHHNRLHLNFSSSAGLAHALAAVPFLVRCGTAKQQGGSSWHQQPCGPVRHKLPELLQISCIPTHTPPAQQLTDDVTKLLSDMQLEHTALWFPASNDASRTHLRDTSPRLTAYVLPRNINTLAADIERIHQKFTLYGGAVKVQALNVPQLTRCTQCHELGHTEAVCPKYAGLAIRLLFKEPLPFASLRTLTEAVHARVGYLGSGVDEMAPSRRVTLLFDLPSSDEVDAHRIAMEEVPMRFEPLMSSLQPLLAGDISVVRPKDRHRECRQCGSMERPHQCRFIVGHARSLPSTQTHAVARNSDAAPAQSVAQSSTAAPPRRPAAPHPADADGMCRSWHRNKTCPRMAKGASCQFKHPAEYEVQPQVCFDFRDFGRCRRGTMCSFSHVQAAPQQQQQAVQPAVSAVTVTLDAANAPTAPAAASGAVTSASTQPAAAPSAAPASSSSSSSAATTAAAVRKRKKTNAQATDEDSAPAAPASSSSPSESTRAAPLTASKRSRKTQQATDDDAAPAAASTAFGLPSHSTLWSLTDMMDEDDDEKEAAAASSSSSSSSPAKPAPISSLSTMASPNKNNGSNSKPTSSTSATPTRSSSVSRKL